MVLKLSAKTRWTHNQYDKNTKVHIVYMLILSELSDRRNTHQPELSYEFSRKLQYMKYELIATATFGLEAVVKMELQTLVTVWQRRRWEGNLIGDERAIVHTNMWLRLLIEFTLRWPNSRPKHLKNYSSRFKVAWLEDYLTADAVLLGCRNISKIHASQRSIVRKHNQESDSFQAF